MSEYVVRGAVPNHTVRVEDEGEVYWHMTHLPVLEEVVRCRDCEYRRRSWNGHEPNFIGDWFCSYTGGHEVKPDGFCYRGKRRDA